jgi:hypothetical protein
MTTRATKHSPKPRSGSVIERPTARMPPAAPPAPHIETELESRIKRRRVALIAKLGELRAESRDEAHQAGDRIKGKLSEVGHIIKDCGVDGWVSLGDAMKHKLERWLVESEGSLAGHDLPAADARA